MLKLRSALTLYGHGRLLLDALSPKRRAVVKNPYDHTVTFAAICPTVAVDICIAWLLEDTSATVLLHPLQRCSSLHRTASKTMRRSLPLLALATLSAAFVPPQQPHLAVRVRADEIEAAEVADAEPRTAPEVNSGAEAVALRAGIKVSRHAIAATG